MNSKLRIPLCWKVAMYYSPSATTAWSSVAYIQDQVTLGWFIRGLHSHGASAMVIVAGLHLMQTALWGAYKKPREVTWIVGVLMLGLILAFALTGYLLPWDQKGYWATKVATGIMGQSPVIGGWLQRLVQGGNEYGNLTLTRFFALHVFVLPATLILLVVVHIALFRKNGVTPKWGRAKEDLERTTAPFWPDQLFRDLVAMAIVFVLMLVMTVRGGGVELGAPADPASGYDARPEWYFLPLFQMLKYFHGSMETIAALGAPVVVGGILLSVPFLDRKDDRSPGRRIPYLTMLGLVFAGAGSLMFAAMRADANNPDLGKRMAEANEQARQARTLALEGVPPAGGTSVYENEPYHAAKLIWKERCAGCHEDNDQRKAPVVGAGYNSRAWIKGLLTDPDGDAYFGRHKKLKGFKSRMKPAEEKGDDLDALVEFVYSQQGRADVDADKAKKGKDLFDNGKCSDCHFDDGESTEGTGPNLGGRGSRAHLARFIADSGQPLYFGEHDDMPEFGSKLSPEQIDLVADYVTSLAGERVP